MANSVYHICLIIVLLNAQYYRTLRCVALQDVGYNVHNILHKIMQHYDSLHCLQSTPQYTIFAST